EKPLMEENNPNLAPATSGRRSVKAESDFNCYPVWKEKWKKRCCRRVREDRSRLIWKMRLPGAKSLYKEDEDAIKSALQGIVSDELRRIRQVDDNGDKNKKLLNPQSAVEDDDMLWEYEGLHDAYDCDREEILLEMQRIFYEDLKEESNMKESEPWEDREDEYLARAVYEHMQLSNEVEKKKVWCPVCMEGELVEKSKVIDCTLCPLQLDKCDEVTCYDQSSKESILSVSLSLSVLIDDLVWLGFQVTLERVECRLADVHAEHYDGGCRQKPKLGIGTRFGLTALYISCEECNIFDLVI
ncbi:hypothetical protein LINPERHAP1_LOCUS42763, partial [Linum perenne]